ncbi:MAG: GDSL-type esterase/lipase family protein [Pseudomonadota bacterium]
MPPQGEELYTYDADLFWRPRPHADAGHGYYRTNALGLRDDEFPKRSEEHRFSVLVLGDSPTWGFKVLQEETYPHVLEQLLQEARPGLPIEVLNAGVCAFSTQQSLILERRLLAEFPFDLVVIDNMGSDRRFNLDASADKDFVYSAFRTRINSLVIHSRLLTFFRDSMRRRDREGVDPNARPAMSRVAVEDYRANLVSMVTEAEDHGAQAILLLPMPLHDSPQERVDRREARLEPIYQQAMREAAQATGAACLDLPARVQGRDLGGYFLDATHPTPEGHRFIAEVLRDAVLPYLDARAPER